MSTSLVLTIYALIATVVVHATVYNGANIFISGVAIAALIVMTIRRIKSCK